MSTRGLFAFKHNDKFYGFYNHYDSYPTGLGYDIINTWFDNKEQLAKVAANLSRIVSDDAEQTLDEVVDGEFEESLSYLENENSPVVRNQINFLADSLFCEWAYLIDCTKNEVLVFRGFNKQPIEVMHSIYQATEQLKTRCTVADNSGYYPCSFVCQIFLDSPTLNRGDLLTTLREIEDREND